MIMKEEPRYPQADEIEITPEYFPRMKNAGELKGIKTANPLKLAARERELAEKEISETKARTPKEPTWRDEN